MNKICPISGYNIKTNSDWIIVTDNYKIEISIIGNNILHTKNYGYATSHSISISWPLIENIIKTEIKTEKFFVVNDYSEYKGANAKVRLEFVNWIKKNDEKLLGIYIYNTNSFTKILLNSGKLLLKEFSKSHILKDYRETILRIKEINEVNSTTNKKIEWKKGFSFLSESKRVYTINKIFRNEFETATINTFIINENIIFRRYEGLFNDKNFDSTINEFEELLLDNNINKYHLYIEYSDKVSMSLSYRKKGINWFNNNNQLLTAGFFNVTNFNRLIITLAKPFLTNIKLIKFSFIQKDFNEAINVIENHENTSENIKESIPDINSLSKKELKKELVKLRIEKENILKTQKIEVQKIYNKLGRISWDENYNFDEKAIETESGPFKDIHNAIIIIQNDIKEIIQKRDDLVKAAKESEKLKAAFLANMSHEIRTPMNAIIGFADVLKSLTFDKKQKQFLNIISNSGNHLLKLINNIVDISKIQAEGLTLSHSNFNIYELIEEIVNELQILKQNVAIKINIPDKELIIYADKTRIKQVFINLLNNAIKFTENGEIKIGYELSSEKIIFFVKDTGVGISKKELNKIFIKFTQVGNNKNKINEGAGLGLTISKSIIEAHDGKIWVKSELNIGSTFYFSLPSTCVTNNYIIDNTTKLGCELLLTNKKILIAEDKDSNYLLLKELLNDKNTLIRAINGIEAISMYMSENPDIILMDIQMPECNGFEATREIRKLDKNIPIIGQTAFAIKKPKANLIKKGFTNHIAKPIIKSELYKILNELEL